MFIKAILFMLAFLFVLVISYYSCRWIASLQKGVQQSGYMKIRDKLLLSKDKAIQIVQIGGQYLLMGITNDGITLLKELDTEEMEEFFARPSDSMTMDTILKTACRTVANMPLWKNKSQQRFVDVLKEKMMPHAAEEKMYEK